MRLQTASRLAIFAVLELASEPGGQLAAAEIAARYGVSIHHLSKVLHTLGRAGLVRSVRGAGGGYVFSGNVKRTTLFDVVSLFERLGAAAGEHREPGEDTPAGVALRQVLDEIDEIAVATLNSITISTMLKMAGREEVAAHPRPGISRELA